MSSSLHMATIEAAPVSRAAGSSEEDDCNWDRGVALNRWFPWAWTENAKHSSSAGGYARLGVFNFEQHLLYKRLN